MDVIQIIIAIVIVSLIWRRFLLRSRVTSITSFLDDSWSSSTRRNFISNDDRKNNRLRALKQASIFLKPYKELMGEHCLANENCKVNLVVEKDGTKKIICINKHLDVNNVRKLFSAKISADYSPYYVMPLDYVVDNLWDTLCLNFETTTVYENVLSALQVGMLDVQESKLRVPSSSENKTQHLYDEKNNIKIRSNNLLNINSATEAEILALPGVNIVMAKKIIKYVEKTGGFKSVDEFIEKMKIKPVFAQQIRNAICVSFDDVQSSETQVVSSNEPEILDNIAETKKDVPLPTSDERIIDL